MIIGDPFIFALEFQPVAEWNEGESLWINGIFTLYVDGEKLPANLDSAELTTSLGTYTGLDFTSFNSHPNTIESDILINIASKYIEQPDGQSLSDFNETHMIDLTCTVMEDQGCYVFLAKQLSQDILIFTTDNGLTMRQRALPLGIVESVIAKCPLQLSNP